MSDTLSPDVVRDAVRAACGYDDERIKCQWPGCACINMMTARAQISAAPAAALVAALRAELAAAKEEAGRRNVEIARLREYLRRIAAPIECGCVPCTGQCRGTEAKAIYFEEAQDMARAALEPKP